MYSTKCSYGDGHQNLMKTSLLQCTPVVHQQDTINEEGKSNRKRFYSEQYDTDIYTV